MAYLRGSDDDRGSGEARGIIDQAALLIRGAAAGQHLSRHLTGKGSNKTCLCFNHY
jgi:hypothetical protein